MKALEPWMVEWIDFNLYLFRPNIKASEQDRQIVYEFYNHIFDTKKKPNSCGRCWRNTKGDVYKHYLKQKQQ